jgi:effector-binding domain-containing protein
VGRVVPGSLPGGEVATTTHVGSYDDVAAAYSAVERWLDDQGLVPVGDPWESYLDGPEVAQPRTVVCFPCARRDQPGDPA